MTSMERVVLRSMLGGKAKAQLSVVEAHLNEGKRVTFCDSLGTYLLRRTKHLTSVEFTAYPKPRPMR
jgi:hypothetical protein